MPENAVSSEMVVIVQLRPGQAKTKARPGRWSIILKISVEKSDILLSKLRIFDGQRLKLLEA